MSKLEFTMNCVSISAPFIPKGPQTRGFLEYPYILNYFPWMFGEYNHKVILMVATITYLLDLNRYKKDKQNSAFNVARILVICITTSREMANMQLAYLSLDITRARRRKPYFGVWNI